LEGKVKSVNLITWSDFKRVDIRVGIIVAVRSFPQARKPAYRLEIDFGALGIKKSSAQITNYTPAQLQGSQVVAVVNLPPKQVGPAISEVLVLGGIDADGTVCLLRPDPDCDLGSQVA
jgi:tRNA-binding protein